MQGEHRSWDAEWAERQNIPEWPMWLLSFAVASVLFVAMQFLGCGQVQRANNTLNSATSGEAAKGEGCEK